MRNKKTILSKAVAFEETKEICKAVLGSIITLGTEQVVILPCDIGECVISESGDVSYKKEINILGLETQTITTVFSILRTGRTITKEEFDNKMTTNVVSFESEAPTLI